MQRNMRGINMRCGRNETDSYALFHGWRSGAAQGNGEPPSKQCNTFGQDCCKEALAVMMFVSISVF
ncbi:MAG TPA: hypothetical protein VJ698_04400 [Noviherbaspirillum sp.]|uniref:hypothetical protein n=1 Tax=Noviherbaspirillum sp. TaxID=1926288 RepID=UPI002B469709|nr:hypothetical protein [Noviherbaspirillum sp.]HJV84694.1 hypothetical protein [Noviherbaspirillum sp.]